MKKLLFSLSTLFLLTTVAIGQDNPEKALSKAGRALGSYNLDPANNTDKLKEAIKLIKVAAESDVTNGKFKTWNTRGEIYNALSDQDISLMTNVDVGADFVPKHPEAPVEALKSFEKALGLAVKKFEKKDALTGLEDAFKKLNVIGNNQIQRADYTGAYNSLDAASKAHELTVAAGKDALISDEDMPNHKFVMGYCAEASGNKGEAKKIYQMLYDAGSEEVNVYSSLATMLLEEGSKEEALAVLEKGGEKFPSSTEILFAKINYYIGEGDQEALRTMLVKAVEQEPDNPSVHSALGNVYMQFFAKEYEADRGSEKAEEYFKESKKYFDNAERLDPEAFDAIFNIGSLYFNRAAEELKYASTLSIKQQKEYDEANTNATNLMETALPYFKKAEAINPNDQNTLIALKEIYARTNDFEKVKEFKGRLEKVQAGEKNESSFFDK